MQDRETDIVWETTDERVVRTNRGLRAEYLSPEGDWLRAKAEESRRILRAARDASRPERAPSEESETAFFHGDPEIRRRGWWR